jgi:cardiolipin synthase
VKRVVTVLQAAGVPLRWGVPRKAHGVLRRWTEDHNKIVILDGRVAWCGGANISDSFDRFNDLMLRVEGPAAITITENFEHDWHVAGVGSAPQGPDATYTAQGLLPAGSKPGLSTVRVVSTGPGRLTFEGALVNAIRSARTQIQVQQQQFGYDLIIDELIKAHRRGVEVRVLVDPCNIDNFIPVFHHGPRAIFNAHAVLRLKEAGVTVRAVKVEEVFDAYHMKVGTFDRTVMLVGTRSCAGMTGSGRASRRSRGWATSPTS